MKITYDPEVDVLYIKFSDERPVDNIDIEEDIVSYDIDNNGHLVGIEILGASKRFKDFNKVEIEHYLIPIKKQPKKRTPKKQKATA
ncbi:MAG: DUF2283 domain-containing protein [candidate division Zixibacteria bacterium]|nr:DUF2283 domain-containing protein [Candidatus Tariuqbacter arcticus]